MTCPPRAHTGCTPPAALAAGIDRARWCRTRLRLTAPSVGLRFAARTRRGAGDRACSDRLVYAPFHHVVPGVAPTVPRTPTVAGARACGAEHDPDSGVDCVQIATTVHDTVNSWQPGRGRRALTHARSAPPGAKGRDFMQTTCYSTAGYAVRGLWRFDSLSQGIHAAPWIPHLGPGFACPQG